MKILYSKTHYKFNYVSGGSVAHTAGIVNAFAQKAQIEIISNEFIGYLNGYPQTIIEAIGKSWYGEFIYNFVYANKLVQKIRSYKPDFVYHRFSGFSFATVKTCQMLNIPCILEFNSSDLWKSKYWSSDSLRHKFTLPIRTFILSILEPYVLNHSTVIVVVSKALKQSLVNRKIKADKILVNPNGVDIKKFTIVEDDKKQKLRLQLNIPNNKLIIGFSGTFGPWHGIPDLTDAILLANKNNELHEKLFFILFGEGGPLYKMMMQKIGHYDNVLFAGTIPFQEIQNYLAICDILLSPHGKTADGKEFFGSPTKLFEYMALSKPIIASSLGQIGDILHHLDNAYLFEPGNVAQLYAGIVELSCNKKLREKLAHNARSTVVNGFTWDHNIKRLLSFYDSIIKSL